MDVDKGYEEFKDEMEEMESKSIQELTLDRSMIDATIFKLLDNRVIGSLKGLRDVNGRLDKIEERLDYFEQKLKDSTPSLAKQQRDALMSPKIGGQA